MSDRHYGVGGDGVVYLYPSQVADVAMRMFNLDGSEGAMCGNAVRCIGRLLNEKTGKTSFTVETKAGIRSVWKDGDLFTVDMGIPLLEDRTLYALGRKIDYTFVDMGNPHCVLFMEADLQIVEALERHPVFPDGINIEFVTVVSDGLNVRVWERGSGETLSCGTGACAAAAAAECKGFVSSPIKVGLKGGILTVNYNGNIFLTGDAVKIYEGDYYDKIYFCYGRSS